MALTNNVDLYKILDPAKRFLAAMETGLLSDYELCLGNEKVMHCHLGLIRLISPNLVKLLKKKKDQLRLWLTTDPHSRHLFCLLLHIIHGRDRKTETEDVHTLMQLSYLGKQLNIPCVVDYCNKEVFRKIGNSDNELVWLALQFARDVAPQFSSFIAQKVAMRPLQFLQQEQYSIYTKSRLQTVLSQKVLHNVSELRMFQECAQWATADPNEVVARRDALRLALPFIRFRLFSGEDIVNHVIPTGLLSVEQERDLLRSCVTGKDFMPLGFSTSTESRMTKGGNMENGRVVSKPVEPVASSASYVTRVPQQVMCDYVGPPAQNGDQVEVASLDLKHRLLSVLNNKVLPDVTILVDCQEAKCHSIVVSLASAKLAALVKKNQPQLSNVDPDHFHALLEIIYTGELFNRTNLSKLAKVGSLAFQLEVPAAYSYLARVLCETGVSFAGDMATIFDFAQLIQDGQLIHCCIEALQNSASLFLKSEPFSSCSIQFLQALVQQDILYNISEVELFQACVSWCKANRKKPMTSSNVEVSPLFHLIRFMLFSSQDLTRTVCPTGMLSATEERDILSACITGNVDFIPDGFSKSNISRDPSKLFTLKFTSGGDKFLNPMQTSFPFELLVNKDIFIHGVKFLASHLPHGSHYVENLFVEILWPNGKNVTNKFRGFVTRDELVTIRFDNPVDICGHHEFTVLIRFDTTYCKRVVYEKYKAGKQECGTGLIVSWRSEFKAPPQLHLLVADKVPG